MKPAYIIVFFLGFAISQLFCLTFLRPSSSTSPTIAEFRAKSTGTSNLQERLDLSNPKDVIRKKQKTEQPSSSSPSELPSLPSVTALPSAQNNDNSNKNLFFDRMSPLLRNLQLKADELFDMLINNHPDPTNAVVLEIGAFDCAQAIVAARRGFKVITMEPSPSNLEKCDYNIKQAFGKTPSNLILIAAAASNTTGGFVQFNAVGSTGDHIGINKNEVNEAYHTGSHLVDVPTKRIDDILAEHSVSRVYMTKIDTQGYEPIVLQGMTKTLENQVSDYIMMEFWPKSIGTVSQYPPHYPLYQLSKSGYVVHDLRVGVLNPSGQGSELDYANRPDKFEEYGQWYINQDEKYRNSFGHWTDVIAVALRK